MERGRSRDSTSLEALDGIAIMPMVWCRCIEAWGRRDAPLWQQDAAWLCNLGLQIPFTNEHSSVAPGSPLGNGLPGDCKVIH